MKKVLALSVVLCLIVAGVALATVVSSKHDMRPATLGAYKAVGAATSQVCVFCHHPHRGASTVSTVLLWNISDTANTYNTYGPTPTSGNGAAGTIGGQTGTNTETQYTLLCLGCHDGAGATNSWVQPNAADGTLGSMVAVGGAANLGSTLEDDHPVDFLYTDAYGAGYKGSGAGDIKPNTGNFVIGAVTSTSYPLFSTTMQCATCHDVHNGQSPLVQFMRGGSTNVIANSGICRDCHQSK